MGSSSLSRFLISFALSCSGSDDSTLRLLLDHLVRRDPPLSHSAMRYLVKVIAFFSSDVETSQSSTCSRTVVTASGGDLSFPSSAVRLKA
jgi:hypothetical protein